MTASDIGRIAFAVAVTEFAACMLTNRFIFRSEQYARTVGAFERAKARRDKAAASLAAKQASMKEQQQGTHAGKKHNHGRQASQKSTEKEAKRLQRESAEFSALAAEVARKHTMGGFYSSIAFVILYRVLAAEYAGRPVALLPFEPFNLLRRVTFRGLSDASPGEANSLWLQSLQSPGASPSPDVASASQACAFAFVYVLCSMSVKMMVNMAFGTKPPAGADEGVGNLIEAPQSQKMMKNFGLDPNEVKEARKAVGF
ncbi:hypothetical protein ACHAWF_002462 [Thalassiosira exigua]